MKDFLGQDISVGDIVIFSRNNRLYRGKVVGFDNFWDCNIVIVEHIYNDFKTIYEILSNNLIIENIKT